MAAGAEAEAGLDAVLGVVDSGGAAGVGGFAEAVVGTGVEDASGVGKEEAGGATALTDCAVGLASGVWAKAPSVKKLRALRIKETLFINNVTLIKIAQSVGPGAKGSVVFEGAG